MENKCDSCGEEFDEPIIGDSEEYVCPFCGSPDWDTIGTGDQI